jgi:hypothetical protein
MATWKKLLVSGSEAKVSSLYVSGGATKVTASGSLFVFANNSNKEFGYLSSSTAETEITGIPGYDTNGNLIVSTLIDGGSY